MSYSQKEEWLKKGGYLPLFFRNKKYAIGIFNAMHALYMTSKTLSFQEIPEPEDGLHFFVDYFLHYAANHGYTLQESRAKLKFNNFVTIEDLNVPGKFKETDKSTVAWMQKGEHLPDCLLDFDDQGDLFLDIQKTYKCPEKPIFKSYISAHIYIVDRVLWYFAARGYVLKKMEFSPFPKKAKDDSSLLECCPSKGTQTIIPGRIFA